MKYKFRDLIEQNVNKNSELLYGPDLAIGVNIDKEIRVMKGDASGKDLSKFYIVSPQDFVYNPRGSRKLGLGFNDSEETYITTFNNVIFRIKEEARGLIDPTYLFMYMSRKEWDRKAEWLSWGSSTEVFLGKRSAILRLSFHYLKCKRDILLFINRLLPIKSPTRMGLRI